jgi:hypothetical protein
MYSNPPPQLEVEVEVNLRPIVSQPVCLGVGAHLEIDNPTCVARFDVIFLQHSLVSYIVVVTHSSSMIEVEGPN